MSKRIPKVIGIYKITCIANDRVYIGSSTDVKLRWKQHRKSLQNNKHHNIHLQRAWNKYGEQSFIFEVIELVMPWSLLDRENYWLNEIKPFGQNGFNIGTTAEAPTRGTTLSDETKLKISKAHTGKTLSAEQRNKISAANKGRVPTTEHIANIIATRMANGGYHVSEEARIKISIAGRGRKRSSETQAKISVKVSKQYIVTSPDGDSFKVFGLKPFCREHGLSSGAMCDVSKGRRKHYKGWKCRYDE